MIGPVKNSKAVYPDSFVVSHSGLVLCESSARQQNMALGQLTHIYRVPSMSNSAAESN